MSLTFTEIEAITNEYFMADGRKAVDIYFNDCFAIDYFMNQKKGLWERPAGGRSVRIPLSYDGQEGGFYSKASTLSSDDKESLNSAKFLLKHAYGNATIHRLDELENVGEYAEVQLVTAKLEGAQKKIRKDLATELYSAAIDTAEELTGLLSLTTGTSTVNYGGIAEDDLVAADSTKPWAAKSTTDTEAISLAVLRTLRTKCKIGSGKAGKADVGLTTEALFNIVNASIQVQQRFTADTDTAKAGFTTVVFEGMLIAADDYCPSGDFFALNSNHIGFAIHKNGFFVREPWGALSAVGTPAKTMKIFWDGNLICNNRKAHAVHTNLN